jgi:hypothetical protein
MPSRQDLETALAATADRLNPGTGAAAADHFKYELGMIASPSDNDIKRYARGDVLLVAPAVVEAQQTDGDPVTIGKPHAGLIAVFPDGVVIVRGVAFGARESKAYAATDLTIERITTVLDGSEVPGVRISGRHGRPKLAFALTQEKQTGVAAEQASVSDEIVRLLAR